MTPMKSTSTATLAGSVADTTARSLHRRNSLTGGEMKPTETNEGSMANTRY